MLTRTRALPAALGVFSAGTSLTQEVLRISQGHGFGGKDKG